MQGLAEDCFGKGEASALPEESEGCAHASPEKCKAPACSLPLHCQGPLQAPSEECFDPQHASPKESEIHAREVSEECEWFADTVPEELKVPTYESLEERSGMADTPPEECEGAPGTLPEKFGVQMDASVGECQKIGRLPSRESGGSGAADAPSEEGEGTSETLPKEPDAATRAFPSQCYGPADDLPEECDGLTCATPEKGELMTHASSEEAETLVQASPDVWEGKLPDCHDEHQCSAASALRKKKLDTGQCCAHCRRSKGDGVALLVCARCKDTHYCGRDCQRSHWPWHRADCYGTQNVREHTTAPDRVHRKEKVKHKHFCAQCLKFSADGVDLHLCMGCRAVMYCSPSCQKSHWKSHRADCRAVQLEGSR